MDPIFGRYPSPAKQAGINPPSPVIQNCTPLAAGAWHSASLDAAKPLKSAAVQQAQASMQKEYQGQISDLKKQKDQRDVQIQGLQSALNQKFQSAITPQQVAQLVTQLMGLKEPVQVTTPQPTPTKPNPQPVAVVPLEEAPQAKQYFADCETCKLSLAKAQADAEDRIK